MPKKQCQSCGMPLKLDSPGWGTNKDHSKSDKYCTMCYKNGQFVNSEIDTAEKMQNLVFDILRQKRIPKFLVKLMIKDIPQLERWK